MCIRLIYIRQFFTNNLDIGGIPFLFSSNALRAESKK